MNMIDWGKIISVVSEQWTMNIVLTQKFGGKLIKMDFWTSETSALRMYGKMKVIEGDEWCSIFCVKVLNY